VGLAWQAFNWFDGCGEITNSSAIAIEAEYSDSVPVTIREREAGR